MPPEIQEGYRQYRSVYVVRRITLRDLLVELIGTMIFGVLWVRPLPRYRIQRQALIRESRAAGTSTESPTGVTVEQPQGHCTLGEFKSCERLKRGLMAARVRSILETGLHDAFQCLDKRE
jgi:hypothetical protein